MFKFYENGQCRFKWLEVQGSLYVLPPPKKKGQKQYPFSSSENLVVLNIHKFVTRKGCFFF